MLHEDDALVEEAVRFLSSALPDVGPCRDRERMRILKLRRERRRSRRGRARVIRL